MALTDNTFSVEELEAAYAANPALLDTVKTGIEKLGLRKTIVDETTRTIYDNLDKDLSEVSGIAKENNEKSLVYAKRLVNNFKTAAEAATPLQLKITELETAIANGAGDATMKAQLEQYKQKETDWQKEKGDYGTKLFQAEVKGDIRLGMAGLKYNEAIPKTLVDLARQSAESTVLGMAATQKTGDKTSIVYMENGQVKLNAEGQAADAGYIVRELLKDVLDTGVEGAGGGGQGGPRPPRVGADGQVVVPDTLPETVKTQAGLIDYLLSLGVKQYTEAFDKAFAKHKGTLPMR